MTVFFNKHRGQWAYNFICEGIRHQGYCIHSDGRPAKNKTEATNIEDIIRGKIKSGQKKKDAAPPPVAGFAFAEPMAFYLKRLQGKSDFKNVQTYAKELLSWFGPATDMADIDEAMVAEYTAWSRMQKKKVYIGLKNGERQYKDGVETRSPKTINAYLQTIERAFNAFRLAPENKPIRHLVPEPPEIEYLDVPKRTPTPIPHNVSTKLLEKADEVIHAHLRLAYILCVNTGMREKECAKVLDRQYMEVERMIVLTPEQTKSDAGRFLPVNDLAHQAIMECRRVGDLLWKLLQDDRALRDEYREKYAIRNRGDINLILYRPKGTGMPRPVKHLANTGWDTMRKNAGADYRWHDTRAAFCTSALAAGADIRIVKELAGHESILTTDKYLKASNPLLRSAVDAIATQNPMKVTSESLTEVTYNGKSRRKGNG